MESSLIFNMIVIIMIEGQERRSDMPGQRGLNLLWKPEYCIRI